MLDFIDTKTANKKKSTNEGRILAAEMRTKSKDYLDVTEFNRKKNTKHNKKLAPEHKEVKNSVHAKKQIILGTFTNKTKKPDKPEKNVDKLNRGLPNITLSCYLNSALQSLYNDLKFRNIVLNSKPSGTHANAMKSVKQIFEYLNKQRDLQYNEIKNLYEKIGHENGKDSAADEWRMIIETWFEKSIPNKYKIKIICAPNDEIQPLLWEDYYNFKDLNRTSPNTLEIEVKRRFNWKSDEKNVKNINMPTQLDINGCSYELKFAIVHYGIDNAGHYVSYAKKETNWSEINDDYVTVCSWETIKKDIGCNCTFLRYERVS